MARHNLEQERALSEKILTDKNYDFTAKYMAVYTLQTLTETNPEIINADTIALLEKVLLDYEFTHRTQAYFLYKEVANTLCSLIIHSEDMGHAALGTLKNLLGATNGHPHRATAEALGSLPFSIQGPRIADTCFENVPRVTWQQICEEIGVGMTSSPHFIGRSLVARAKEKDKLLVIKLARSNESLDSLCCESLWMEYLLSQDYF